MTETHNTGSHGGRGGWLTLALAALIAIAGLVLYFNNGREGAQGAGRAPASAIAEDGAAERATREAATDTGQVFGGAGENLAEGAQEAVAAGSDVAERAAAATAEAARDTAQAAETMVGRSTDGDPDSDNNEPR